MLLSVAHYGLNPKQIQHIVECIQNGGIIIYPTDTIYGIGTALSNIKSLPRIIQMKNSRKNTEHYTLLCNDISQLSHYTEPLSKELFKTIKDLTPGPYTFILNASHEVARLFKSNKRQIGIRIPQHPILHQIIDELGEPLINTSLGNLDHQEEDEDFLIDPEWMHRKLSRSVDLIINAGIGKIQYSTVLDCTQDEIQVIREGIGKVNF